MEQHPERVSVVGLGYIGLPTAAVLANRGIDVIGIDVDPRVVETLSRGEVHILEPDLDVLVRAAVNGGLFRASLTPEPASVFMIAVPTPFKEDRSPDLAYVEAACRAIAPVLARGNLVILESTSPVGTTEHVARWLAEERPDLRFPGAQGEIDVHVAHCPERVLPGRILRELVENARVIGGLTPACAEKARDFYKVFVSGKCLLTTARTAELCKLTENAFRDVNIAFANELSLIAERVDVDVWELIALANHHPRVQILQPGPGVGGHCIAVDPWFIVDSAPEESRLIRTAREVNDYKPHWVVGKVRAAAERFKAPRVACLGLAFKANVDDLRESPAVHIVDELAKSGVGEIVAVEPHIRALPRQLAGHANVTLADLRAIEDADIVVCLVDHEAFRSIDPKRLMSKVVIDTRGIWR
ncbi:UDP-N-acetyl-D-mannosamine dehydrogenase [Salinarimonas sp. NSM]|uniref:UDP-N-acetyl-D-mannosamine dehydrogenase n=1 Tax=Salinarimonas sp. NSM TaxID=3458003 RepID=UPI004036709F